MGPLTGWEMVRGVFSAAEMEAACERLGAIGPGRRNLDITWLAMLHPLAHRLRELLPTGPHVVRSMAFDKPPGRSWSLPWHEDRFIAVREILPSEIFTSPSVKAGVPHVQAPDWLLDRMVTVRIHLDACDEENGMLEVMDAASNAVPLPCEAGDVLLIRPRVMHRSQRSRPGTPRHRRILHFELSDVEHLPDGYAWHQFLDPGAPASSTFPAASRSNSPCATRSAAGCRRVRQRAP